MKKLLLGLIILTALTACAGPVRQMSRQDFLKATQREYVNIDKEKLLTAAEELFLLSDGSDYTFSHKVDGLTANRFYNVFYIMSTHQGNFIWNVDVAEKGNNLFVTVGVENQSGGFLAPTYNSPSNEPAVFDLFYRRLDNLLSLSDEWLTCEMARQEYKNRDDIWGDLGPLCYVTADKAPVLVTEQATSQP